MFGWTGKILEVDLGTRSRRIIRLSPEIYERHVGGKGLAGYFLRDKIGLDWDSPLMPLLLFTGPLVGTSAPTSGRMTVMSKSPLTGTVGDASVGGRLGTFIKNAGFDGIVIKGISEKWVGLEISDDSLSFMNADSFVHLTVDEATSRLDPKASVAIIGPAAHANVRFSSLMVDKSFAAARNGIGLCFAAKRLKFLSVKGSGKVAVQNGEELAAAREEIFRLVGASPVLLGRHGISRLGTVALYDLMHARHMMPTDNFSRTYFEPAASLGAHCIERTYSPKKVGCRGCHIRCKKRSADGEHLPEFETLSHFTALLGKDDLSFAVSANTLCNKLGMDTISAAVTLACHLEITGQRLDGPGLLTLLEQIGRGQGIGLELGQGSYRYAKSKGRANLSMTVKGQELPAYDPRGAYGMALAYSVSTRGGCHLRAYPIGHEILRKPVVTDRFSFDGKARIIKISEDLGAIVDSLTACKFIFFASSLEEYSRAYQAVTGVKTTANDLFKLGERIYYLERMMNAQNGFNIKDDTLPKRFFQESGTNGPSFSVPPIDKDEFSKTLQKYYSVRGLDERGMPTRKKARELGIQWRD